MSESLPARQAEVVSQTREWVRENFLYMRPDWPLDETTPLLRSGVVDSIGVIELVAFLERTFGCTIPEREITEENFGTLEAIGRYLARDASATASEGGVR
jgi:acyl carrier protein